MALLNRFVRVHDRVETHVFTFIVTRSLTRDLHRDVTSKEFSYGHHRWAITFSRAGQILGVYLVWRNPSEGMRVYIDFSFTLLNREHFSVNESFTGRQIKFTYESPAQGNRRFIPVDELYNRNFTDSNGEFLLELNMANVRTIYETELRLPFAAGTSSATQSPSHGPSTPSGCVHHPTRTVKLETTYFSFGGFDWNVSVVIEPYSVNAAATAAGFSLNFASNLGLGSGGQAEYRDRERERERERNYRGEHGDGSLLLRLRRLTGVDHRSRVRYHMTIGEGDRKVCSGAFDDVSDAEGSGTVWYPRVRLQDVTSKGTLRLLVEMLSANTLSETTVTLVSNQNSPGVVAGISGGTCYDRDKQAWFLEPDTNAETLRVRMVYRDIKNVPRNHIRYVSWMSSILKATGKNGHYETIPFSVLNYCNYYVQEDADDGIIMESGLPVKDLYKIGSPFSGEKQQLRIQIEWEESFLLFQATYHKYDDVCRIQSYQMRREIAALRSENYSLERQLLSYQRSLSSRVPVEERGLPENGEYRDYYSRRDSSDADYA